MNCDFFNSLNFSGSGVIILKILATYTFLNENTFLAHHESITR